MKYGLSEEQLAEICDILVSYPAVEAAVLYGSRAMDTYKEASDVDIAIKGAKTDGTLTSQLKYHLEEETNLPFFFDITVYNTIGNAGLKKHIRTKGKTIYRKGWREVSLKSLIQEKIYYIKNTLRKPLSSSQRSKIKGCYPYYGAAGKIDSINNYKFEGYHLLVAEDGTITSDGIHPMLQLVDGKFWVSNHAHVLQGNTRQDTLLLYYMLSNVDINKSVTGSVQPKLSKTNLLKIKFLLPPLSEQKAIVEVLGSLDDKIDLLHRQNETLENIAQTLFRKWFIEDADETWEEVELSYFGNVVCGKTPSKKVDEYFGGNIPFIKIPDMHDKTFVFDTLDNLSEEGKDFQKNKTIPPKSICISCIATVGLIAMNAFESQTNQQINSVIPKKDIYRYYIYLFMKSSKNLLEAMASGGTATMNLNTGNFSKLLLPVVEDSIISNFHSVVEPLFNKIFTNQYQTRILKKMRDTFLPRLMNGTTRVIKN